MLCSCDFIDLDDRVRLMTGKTPRELYLESPADFQTAEAAALANTLSSIEGLSVIAAGGGLADNQPALDTLGDTCLKVHLEVPAETAWKRIFDPASPELPPFLQTSDPEKTHRALHERRAAAYRQMADLTIPADGKSPQEIAGEIFRLCGLKSRLSPVS